MKMRKYFVINTIPKSKQYVLNHIPSKERSWADKRSEKNARWRISEPTRQGAKETRKSCNYNTSYVLNLLLMLQNIINIIAKATQVSKGILRGIDS